MKIICKILHLIINIAYSIFSQQEHYYFLLNIFICCCIYHVDLHDGYGCYTVEDTTTSGGRVQPLHSIAHLVYTIVLSCLAWWTVPSYQQELASSLFWDH